MSSNERDLIVKCASAPHLLTRIAGTKFLERCGCLPCWQGALYCFALSPCALHEAGDPTILTGVASIALVSIRSTSPNGTTLSVPIALSYLEGDCSTTVSFSTTVDVLVGRDTKGKWVRLPDFTHSGVTYLCFLAGYKIHDPNYCDENEFATPFPPYAGTGAWTDYDNFVTPGPIKWREVVQLVQGILPVWTGGMIGPSQESIDTALGSPPYKRLVSLRAVRDDLGTVTHIDAATSAEGELNVFNNNPSLKKRSYNRAVFTTPAGPFPGDGATTFNLDIQFVNPFTGANIDGTHTGDDTSDKDIDTDPGIVLVDPAFDEEVFRSATITRLGFGHYRLNNVGFFCQKGVRRFAVFPNQEHTVHANVSRHHVLSGNITIEAGAAEVIDVLPPGTSPNYPTPVLAAEILNDHGGDIVARILDDAGDFEFWNVVDSATDTLTAVLSQPGTNYLGSPSLLGTTSQAAVLGLANFNDLAIHGLGRHYRITFTGTGLSESGNDHGGHIDLNVACDLSFQSLPTIHAGVPCSILVDIVDALGGALTPSSPDQLTLSGGGSFSGFGAATPSGNTATFTGTFPAAGTYSIQVVTSGTNYDGPGTTTYAARTISVTVLP